MSQALRNQYLQQMGIVQYVGKDLPVVAQAPVSQPSTAAQGLQPSAPENLPPVESSVESPAESSAAGSMGARVNALLREKSMAELVNIGLEDSAEAVAPLASTPAQPSEQVTPASDIQLRLALWQPTAELLVCSSVEDSLPQPEQILLLGNILRAMGQGAGPLLQMELVEWPPYPNMSGDEAEVREFLATLIKARIDSSATKILLLLGDTAPQWLLTQEQLATVANGQVEVFGQITALLIPALSTMIQQPDCKRDAWQTIRYLSPQRHVHKADS
jgi:hypothetical protein